MNIFIPVEIDKIIPVRFSYNTQNPGIGGTEFTSIKLALLLARQYPDLSISIISKSPINIEVDLKNLENIVVEKLEDFFGTCSRRKNTFLIICSMNIATSLKTQLLQEISNKTIIWLHHPFQLIPNVKNLGCLAHVHVGRYQFYTNKSFYPSSWFIQNPFILGSIAASKTLPKNIGVVRIVYVGALFEAKGFGHIAHQWLSIKNILPEAELHVIGSSATYGVQPEHPMVPCGLDFGEEILKYIPLEDIETGKVVFHGNLGQEKFDIIRSAHFAILNPTGASEAFPASPLECMACGLPVIASDDYGMSDTMKFFPELSLSSPEDIPGRVHFLMSDRYRYEELSARSVAVAIWFHSQTDGILARWRRLFDLAAKEQEFALPDYPPVEALYGSRFKFMMRKIRSMLGVMKSSVEKTFKNS